MIYSRAWMGVTILLSAGCQLQNAGLGLADPVVNSVPASAKPPVHTAQVSAVESNATKKIATSHVRPVAFEEAAPSTDPSPLPQPAEELDYFSAPSGIALQTEEVVTASPKLQLEDVIQSVRAAYPMLNSARLERELASGKQLSAWGEFDTNLKAFNVSAPLGFYQNYRSGLSLEKPVFEGGYVYSGYKIGDGSFQPWYKERETNESGEFSVGFGVPLLKGREIDKRREALGKADAARQAVEPAIQAQLLSFVREASQAYWSWVAAGKILRVSQDQLEIAKKRVTQLDERIKAGDLPEIAGINNNQLIATRQTKVIESQRKLQAYAIKLSLYLRNNAGDPVMPVAAMLPSEFPGANPVNQEQLPGDIATAIAARPEIVENAFLMQQAQIELAQAENMVLPKLDMQLRASQDVGPAASSKGDKTPFELEVGFLGEVPLQRREAQGKIRSARGKISQLAVKRKFIIEKTEAAVTDAFSALEAASKRIEQASLGAKLAEETLTLGGAQFAAGDISVQILNLYEKSLADARILVIAAQADYFIALADYRAALAINP
ncbi:MAG: TolC family protein [bacterium]|nr:TolC family protein [bacterium]